MEEKYFYFFLRCFKEEQMAVCIRYTVGLDVFEMFLGFIDTSEKQDAEFFCHILKNFKYCNLNKAQIVAQSYYGANVMAGKFNGIQAKIKNTFPYAIFTHCMAHRMNLVIMDMCKHLKVNMNTE